MKLTNISAIQMPKEPVIKKSISDAQLKNELIKLFEAGNTDNTNIYEQIRTRFKIAKERHVKFYHSTLKEWQNLKEKATAEAIHTNTTESLKTGLKSKLERQLEIQQRIIDIQAILISGKTKDVFIDFKKGVPKNYERNLTPGEIAGLNRTMAVLDNELSKMAGDYAPAKVANTDKDGNDLKLDTSNLSPKDLNALLAIKKKISGG